MGNVREELESFHQFAAARLEGGSEASMNELLMEWQDIREREAINEAIREGIADVSAGRVFSAREEMEEIRTRGVDSDG